MQQTFYWQEYEDEEKSFFFTVNDMLGDTIDQLPMFFIHEI